MVSIFVPVDFERDDVGEKLAGRRLSARTRPRFSTWLGVVPYLTQDAIGRTLDYMSSIQNSEVVFDYMEPPAGILRRAKANRKGAGRTA
jgi:O-methyltransferase involved in polyketide biosynthesis